jgi:hypothetical protein
LPRLRDSLSPRLGGASPRTAGAVSARTSTLDVGYRRRPFFVAFLRFFALFFLAFFFMEALPPFPA